jgi:hypothetical protein
MSLSQKPPSRAEFDRTTAEMIAQIKARRGCLQDPVAEKQMDLDRRQRVNQINYERATKFENDPLPDVPFDDPPVREYVIVLLPYLSNTDSITAPVT